MMDNISDEPIAGTSTVKNFTAGIILGNAHRPDNTVDQQSAALPAQPIEQQSRRHEEQQGNIAKVRVADNDPQPGSSSDGKIQSILPPFSGELAVDTHRKLSRKNFKQSIEVEIRKERLTARVDTESLNAVPPYPTPYVLAQFAYLAYEDYNPNESDRDYEKRLGLPEGWKLLTTASNKDGTNGYFGAAYWHPKHQQVVIAHRGTEFDIIKKPLAFFSDIWTDIKGVVFKYYVSQMNSASTFADEVNRELSELNQQHGVNFQLFFTGHSLGGWLAQITAFTTEYLQKVGANFLKNNNNQAGYHARTVVFDSPGCEAMLSQMQKSFDVRYRGRSISLDDLDITSYLSTPNRINTCNSHLGTVYRIFIDLSDMDFKQKHTLQYNLATHSMDKIKKVFDPETGQVHRDTLGQLKVQEVVDWPITTILTGDKEWKDFFKKAEHLNNYHPKIADESFTVTGHYPIRYQTKLLDESSSSLSVFTYAERQFLERYHWLRELKEFSKPEELFSEINDSNTQKDAEEKLENFKIENEVICCTDARALQAFIPYVKRLVQLFPKIQEKTMQNLSSFDVRKKVYRYETAHYLKEIKQSPLDFNSDVIGLGNFLSNDQHQVQQWVIKDTQIGLTKIYRVLQQIQPPSRYQNEESYTALKLKRLLAVHQQMSLSKLFKSSEMRHHLLMVECKANDHLNEAVQAIFRKLFDVLKDKPAIKIILVMQQGDSLVNIIKQDAKEKLNNRFSDSVLEDKPFAWGDLTPNSRRALLETILEFQGQPEQLSRLLGINDLNQLTPDALDAFSIVIDPRALAKQIKGKMPIKIGEPPHLSDLLKAAYYSQPIDKRVEPENLEEALVNAKDSELFLITGFDLGIPEDEHKIKTEAENKREAIKKYLVSFGKNIGNKKIIVAPDDENDQHLKNFKELCKNNPDKTIHWVSLTDGKFIWQQLYDHKFYVKRRFNRQNRIVIKEDIKDSLILENPEDLFVISDFKESALPINLVVSNDQSTFENSMQEELSVLLNFDKKQIEAFKKNNHQENVILTVEENAADKFNKLIQKAKKAKKSVHWLKIEARGISKQLIWQRSYGTLDTLRQFIDVDKSRSEPVPEDDLTQVNDKVVIIAGEPGMGKSTALARWSEQKYKTSAGWVIPLVLKDCQQAIQGLILNNLKDPERGIIEVIQFLSKASALGSESPFTQILLRYALKYGISRPLLLLFDGFDEVKKEPQPPDETVKQKTPREKVIKLLRFLKEETKANILVTTRESQTEILENGLLLFATELKVFLQEEQEEFLKYFWKSNFKFKYSQNELASFVYKPFITALMEKANQVLGETTSHFIGIPLQIRMLAEVFQPEFEKYRLISERSELEKILEKFDVYNLYQKYIDAKYEIYFKEKARVKQLSSSELNNLKTGYNKAHKQLALKNLFSKQAIYLLENKNEQEKIDLINIGIVQEKNNNLEFLHRTFEEYFTAKLLEHWLKKPWGRHPNYKLSVENFLLTDVLMQSDYNALHLFLNSQINQIKHTLTNSTLTRFGEQIQRLWSGNYFHNKQGETALHIMAQAGHIGIIDFLFKSLKAYGKNKRISFYLEAVDKNNLTPLHRAALGGHSETVTMLINNGANVGTFLDWAAKNGKEKAVQALLDGVKHDKETLGTLDRKTALKSAVLYGHGKVAQVLVDYVEKNLPEETVEEILKDQQIFLYKDQAIAAASEELSVDKALILSHKNFKQSLEESVKGKRLSTAEQLNAVPPYPTPYVLAQFAIQAYKDYKPNEQGDDSDYGSTLPKEWRLLTTAANTGFNNNYFGAAYWHPERQQVVIAHRGDLPGSLGFFWALIKVTILNKYIAHINSASTFAEKVNTALCEINKKPGVNFQLFFTGHSLGGWLAQITTFTTEYLKKEGDYFFKNNNVQEGYHAHTVVFESPGCKEMLLQMEDKFDVRLQGHSIDLTTLDINNYLLAPNAINTQNTHLGSVYRIFTDLSDMSWTQKHTTLYHGAMHSMRKILQAFDPETGQVSKDESGKLKMQVVADWPRCNSLFVHYGDNEYKDFFQWAGHLNNYHPDITDESFAIKGYYPIRYQTKDFDEQTSSLCVFTQSEQQFLKSYQRLRELKLLNFYDLFSDEDTDEDIKKSAKKLLEAFSIKENTIHSTSAAETLQTLIPSIKRLLQLFPNIKSKTENALYYLLKNPVPQDNRPVSTIDQQSPASTAQPVEGLQPVQPVSNQQSGVMAAAVLPSHHNPQLDPSYNRDKQSILPPFSKKLTVDTHLILSHENFKQFIEVEIRKERLTARVATESLNAVPTYPTPYVFAQFSLKVYEGYKYNEKDRDYEKRLKLPDGWKLLITATNTGIVNDYFGAAYWHPERQQVVIAHRGGLRESLGSTWALVKGTIFNKYITEINSASTFAEKVNTALCEFNKKPGVNFQLFFTGHSLGGWLAQITTFTTEYLKKEGDYFFKNNNVQEGYHAHTVVFESPGCKEMLLQMEDKFDVRLQGHSIDLTTLDINNYLLAPNAINTQNTHLGSVYRIFTDLSDMSWTQKHTTLYHGAMHSMRKILQAFDPETGQVSKDESGKLKMQVVADWPRCNSLFVLYGGRDKEYKDFFEWAGHLNNYHPNITDESFAVKDYYLPIRYQTKDFDEQTSSLCVFTQSEQQFLKSYQRLRELKLLNFYDLFSDEDTDEDIKKSAKKLLEAFSIKENTIHSTSAAETLQTLIPSIKRLLQLFPNIKSKTENAYL